MVNDIYLIGGIGQEVTLTTFIEAYSKVDKKEVVTVDLHSGGGNPYDGVAIYNFMKKEQANGVRFATIANGLTASAATPIFLAGNTELREVHDNSSFLIHEASTMAFGKADDLEHSAKELRRINNILNVIYARETGLSMEVLSGMMGKDEMLNVDFLISNGFAKKKIEFKAVANYNNPKNKQMENKEFSKEDKNWLTTMFAKFGKSQITNKIVQDAQGVEIDFYDLEDTDTIKVGDKAKVGGNDANESYLMPDDKGTYVFVNGELTEIQEVATGGEDDTEALKQQIADLKEQLQASATQTEDIQATVKEKETLIASMTSDMEEIKAKVTSSFAWDGKQEKKEEVKVKKRKIFKDK